MSLTITDNVLIAELKKKNEDKISELDKKITAAEELEGFAIGNLYLEKDANFVIRYFPRMAYSYPKDFV